MEQCPVIPLPETEESPTPTPPAVHSLTPNCHLELPAGTPPRSDLSTHFSKHPEAYLSQGLSMLMPFPRPGPASPSSLVAKISFSTSKFDSRALSHPLPHPQKALRIAPP